jgi:hypothetical protein
MTTKTTLRTAALLGVASVSALAVPAVASAHPAVYPTTVRVGDQVSSAPGVTPVTYSSYKDQVRYVVANHGYTYVLRESNGRATGTPSVIAWGRSEGRSGDDIVASDAAKTGAQAHATCDVASLNSTAVIRSWQNDPFYAYVPFQTGAAGLEDDPAKWLPVVKSATGVDLTKVADTDEARKAACEAPAVGGTYYPADATQATTATFNSGLIADTKAATAAPFEARITSFEETVAAQNAKQAATEAQLAAANAKLAQATKAPAAPAAAKPLAATLADSTLTPKQLTSTGVPVDVTGAAGQSVRVRATVSAAQARKHRLRSTILGSKAGTVGQDGTGRITVKPSAAQGRKLRSAKGTVPVTLELVVGTTKATVAR